MSHIPIGVQLYSVRDDCKADLPGTLAAIARMGYEAVEFFTFYDRPAKELRATLADLGLKCCGTHIGLANLLGDALPRTIEYNQALGNKYLVVPALPPEYRGSPSPGSGQALAAWRETGRLFTGLAEKVKPHGLQVGYHNHDIEFKPIDGELPFDAFFGAASPEVIMQVDLGNAMHGGGDPIACLRKYPGRATTIHLKEYSKDGKALIGDGEVDWQTVFTLCETTGGTEWYIVEHETYAYPPMECIRRCLENLRKMGK
jgi:sugar phosphate isomerase/epimerase